MGGEFLELWYWESVLYSFIVWIAVFVLLDIERIKALWPIGFLSSGLMLISHIFLSTLNLAHFHEGFLTFIGIPIFHLVWSFGAGILMIGFMYKDFIKKSISIIFFTFLALGLDALSVNVGGHIHINNLNYVHSFFFILLRLILVVWVAEELLREKMYANYRTGT